MKIRKRAAALAVTVLALACTTAFAQRSGGLVPDGVPPNVALVFTGDTIGYIEPCG
jgi:hypothetical protein